jgi:predicted PurR-regulated permease PerM
MEQRRIEITFRSVFSVIFALLLVFLVMQLRDLLILVFFATIFALALNPFVNALHRRHVPRTLAILSIYIIVIGIILILLWLILPPLIGQTVTLVSHFNFARLPVAFDMSNLQGTFSNYNSILSNVGGSIPGVFSAILGTFSSVIVVFTFFVMTFYILAEREKLHHYIKWMFGKTDHEQKAKAFVDRLEVELGGWVRGELMLMFTIGLMTYFGLRLLSMPYALPLAILAGLLEAVPNIGPTISAVPAVALAFLLVSPTMGLVTIVLYILIQQLENTIIVPKVMSRSINISPLVTIIVLIAGGTLDGIQGAILSLPTYILLRNILREFNGGNNPFRIPHGDEEKK